MWGGYEECVKYTKKMYGWYKKCERGMKEYDKSTKNVRNMTKTWEWYKKYEKVQKKMKITWKMWGGYEKAKRFMFFFLKCEFGVIFLFNSKF